MGPCPHQSRGKYPETDGIGAAVKYHWEHKQWLSGLFTACYAFGPLLTCRHIVHELNVSGMEHKSTSDLKYCK